MVLTPQELEMPSLVLLKLKRLAEENPGQAIQVEVTGTD
jgi:hypothetical protein